jgi:glycosyltransferase involved in cell wall biosynthesis
MTGMAQKGLKVLFIENTGVRCPGMNDLPRVFNRLSRAVTQTVKDEAPANLNIFSPLALPFPFSKPAIYYNKQYFNLIINNFLRRYDLKPSEVIFWTRLATPLMNSLIKDYSWGLTLYDVVSDAKLVQPLLEPYEKQLLAESDFTFFASASLYDKYYMNTKNPLLFRDGFNTRIMNENITIPKINKLKRPHFVYIGAVNRKLRVDLIEKLARYFRKGSVIVVGPHTDGIKIPNMKNIHLFPKQIYRNLAGFLRGADAGIVPYNSDDYSGTMHPAKLNEYICFGLPIVATATPELRRLSENWGNGFFYLGDSAEEYVQAADKAITENNRKLKQKRLNMAVENAWDRRINQLSEILTRGKLTDEIGLCAYKGLVGDNA